MKRLNIYLICLGVLFLTSCQDWFDVSPKSNVKAEDLFTQESGFRDVLTGVYSLMSSSQLYGKQLTFGYADVLAQYYSITNNDHEYIETKDYNYEEPYDKDVLETIWSSQYKAIANLNAVLMFIDDNRTVFSEDAIYQIYKGETLALRGLLHFDLLRLYAPSPAMGEDRMAIPYVASYTNLAQPQSTVKEVLDRVVEDLEAARNLMREVDPYGPNYEELMQIYRDHPLLRLRVKHLNYYAVTALLARVQLYAGNKTAALAAAQEIIGSPGDNPVAPFTLTTSASTSNTLFTTEMLFGLEEEKMSDNIDVYFGESITENGITQSSTALGTSLENLEELFDSQNPADNDYRRTLWFQDAPDNTSTVLLSKYTEKTTMSMIHLSELYYIAAECSESDGLAYLNTLRAHRGLVELVAVDDLQSEIYKEYCKEFFGEGQMFYYYKRLAINTIGVLRTIVIDPETVYVLPLPDNELDFGLIE